MLGRIPRLVMAAPLVAVLAVTLAASSGPATERSGSELPALKSISSRLDGAISTVLIEASEPVAYLTSQPDPLTVLVDLRNVQSAGTAHSMTAPVAPVSGVAIEDAKAPDGSPVARIRVSLDHAAKSRVRAQRNMILVEIDRSGAANLLPGAPSAPVAAPARAARTDAPAKAGATELRSVKAIETPDGYAVSLSGNGPLVATSVEQAKDMPARVLLDFRGVAVGKVPATTAVNNGEVQRIRVGVNSREPLITRVVIDLAKMLPYTVETVGEDLRVMFKRASDAAAAAIAPAADPAGPIAATVSEPDVKIAPEPPAPAPAAATPAPIAPTVPAPPAINPAVALAQVATPPPAQQAAQPGGVGAGTQPATRFTGHPVTFDFQGADLRAVLRTFAEISGLNIVIDPSINGTVDVSLKEVPWDQALDIILRANKLSYTVDGTIVRIVPNSVLAQENTERANLAAAEAKSKAQDLPILTRPLSYAKAADLTTLLKTSGLSQYGDVQIDARTNTLIIKDLPDKLASVSDLIAKLDTPQPQVEIEARIVITNRSYAQALGVQWGFNGRVDPALGNGTGLAFPNKGTGTATIGNAAVSGATNAVGLSLGSINGALNLDVALSALEQNGKGRILSTPRVTTQNNVKAEIAQGKKIPVQTTSNNTTTTSYVDATLTLQVTPQITAAGTVIMTIAVDNGSDNPPDPVSRSVSINTQRASTTVLVADGDTTVIGGIYQTRESETETRTPFLHSIPLLGWLFKQDDNRNSSDELLIFITPRIIR